MALPKHTLGIPFEIDAWVAARITARNGEAA
jgi:hypothetical protein